MHLARRNHENRRPGRSITRNSSARCGSLLLANVGPRESTLLSATVARHPPGRPYFASPRKPTDKELLRTLIDRDQKHGEPSLSQGLRELCDGELHFRAPPN